MVDGESASRPAVANPMQRFTQQSSELFAKTMHEFMIHLGAQEGWHIKSFYDKDDLHIYDGDECKGVVRRQVVFTASGGLRFIIECFTV